MNLSDSTLLITGGDSSLDRGETFFVDYSGTTGAAYLSAISSDTGSDVVFLWA